MRAGGGARRRRTGGQGQTHRHRRLAVKPLVRVHRHAEPRDVGQGRLDATVYQDARGQGGTAVETAVRIARGEPFKVEVLIPFQLVTRENADRFLSAGKGR